MQDSAQTPHKPKILIDIDGICLDILSPCVRKVQIVAPAFTAEDWKRYYLRDFYPEDRENVDAAIAYDFIHGDVYETQKALPYSAECLQILAEKYTPCFATSRDDSLKTMQATFSAFQRFGIPYQTIFFAADKIAIARKLKPKFCIEDQLETALKIAKVCQCYLFDYPYNRHVARQQENGRLIRIGNFNEKNWWYVLLGELKARKMI